MGPRVGRGVGFLVRRSSENPDGMGLGGPAEKEVGSFSLDENAFGNKSGSIHSLCSFL